MTATIRSIVSLTTASATWCISVRSRTWPTTPNGGVYRALSETWVTLDPSGAVSRSLHTPNGRLSNSKLAPGQRFEL